MLYLQKQQSSELHGADSGVGSEIQVVGSAVGSTHGSESGVNSETHGANSGTGSKSNGADSGIVSGTMAAKSMTIQQRTTDSRDGMLSFYDINIIVDIIVNFNFEALFQEGKSQSRKLKGEIWGGGGMGVLSSKDHTGMCHQPV